MRKDGVDFIDLIGVLGVLGGGLGVFFLDSEGSDIFVGSGGGATRDVREELSDQRDADSRRQFVNGAKGTLGKGSSPALSSLSTNEESVGEEFAHAVLDEDVGDGGCGAR